MAIPDQLKKEQAFSAKPGLSGKAGKKKTPWLQQDGALGMDRQTLLMGGLGLLTGDKRSGPGYMLQSLSQGIANKQARTKEAEQQAKMDKFAQGLTPEQAALFGIAPEAFAGSMAKQMFAKPESADPATYGNSLHEVIGPDGKPMFVRTDNRGGIHPVEDYSPPPDSAGTTTDRVQSTFVDANGNLQMVMRDGSIRGSGMGVQNPYQITDVGGVPTAIDRRTGQGINISTPEEVGGNKATIDTIVGNEADRRVAQQELPQTIASAQRSIERVNSLIEHEGLDWRYGLSSLGGFRAPVPDTPEAEAQALIDEITGGAFLQAFETLKGGGQITEIEGQKATAAITRLQNQSIGKEAAIRAAKDYIEVIEKGIERAKAEAGGAYAPQGEGAKPLVYNPATEDFE